MRAEDGQEAGVPSVLADFGADEAGDVDEFVASAGGYAEGDHGGKSIAPGRRFEIAYADSRFCNPEGV